MISHWDLLLEAQGHPQRPGILWYPNGTQGSMQPKSAAPSRYLLKPGAGHHDFEKD